MRDPLDEDVPTAGPIQAYLERMHQRLAALRHGEVAGYIPPLSKADPNWFSICIATTDGNVYETGDSDLPFTIQSISKPLVYGLALEDRGIDSVMRRIGVEPTGDAFNSISLAPDSGRPFNPMINAGAIATTSLVAGHSDEDRRDRILDLFSLYAGRRLSIDREVFESERRTGHRNRAIGHMLRNFEIIAGDPEPALDLYFQQCSIQVTCRDLSLMAATLANGGVNPRTGETVTRPELVPSILSVMTTCGMYDFAGEWVFSVGMPAKSGVAGGILAVLPGQLGIGVFSPPLDPRGNSVRGVAACTELSRDFRLHFLAAPRSSRAAVRAVYDLTGVGSKRSRSPAERAVLREAGARAKVYELQGDLNFPTVEAVVRRIVDATPSTDCSVLDLKRVTRVGPEAERVLLELLLELGDRGKHLLLVSAGEHSRSIRFLEEGLGVARQGLLRTFAEMDFALEWCEDLLIGTRRHRGSRRELRELGEHPLCRGIPADAVRRLEAVLERRRFERGAILVSSGESSRDFYFLLSGEVSVSVKRPNGQPRRLSTLGPGMGFGELALVRGGVRSADVRADSAVECLVLGYETFQRLGREDPEVKIVLLENLLSNAAGTVGRLTREISTLAG